jgi:opacity protein-like surface antigen
MRHAIASLVLLVLAVPVAAGDLGDDRADVMYHRYDGGGLTVDGPALLVRKTFAEHYAVTAGYQLDMISNASIDVVTTASPYSEDRHQFDLGFEYLSGKLSYGLGFSHSTEDDYESSTARFAVSQDLFGDLTRLSFAFALGWDDVSRNGVPSFSGEIDRRVYSIDISQILSPRLVAGLTWDLVTEEGFLSNPYRSVRYRNRDAPRGYSLQPEVAPRTRTGSALALRARYQFPYRFAVHGEYRFYADDWDIRSHTLELGYTHGIAENLLFDAHYRFHTQDGADFYADLFPRRDYQEFMTRDRALSSMTTQTIGVGLSYEFSADWLGFLDRSSVSLSYDVILYDYDEFRDLRFTEVPVGREPLYSFDANVIKLYFSGWF